MKIGLPALVTLAVLAADGFILAQDEPARAPVVINEIHYHPDIETELVEFIELHNPTSEVIDLSGWSFSQGIDHVFGADSTIGPGEYYILAQNRAAYNKKFGSIFSGGVKADAQWDGGSLANGGETVTLRNAANEVVDEVDFQDEFPWPVSADGGGVSMELIHPALDNDLSGHWRAASEKPTPGKANSVFMEGAPPAVRQVKHVPKAPASEDTVVISAKATDADGVAAMTLELQTVAPGAYIRLADDAYRSAWQALPMNDAGSVGDEMAGDDIFSATVPAEVMTHRSLIRYRIQAVDGRGQPVILPYADDPTPNRAFFVHDGVPPWQGSADGKPPRRTFTTEELTLLPVYHLIADGGDVDRCQYQSSNESRRFRGTLVYDGKVYDHIEFKVRGEFSTYQCGKNKWKFFFNRGADFEARDNYGIKYARPLRVMNFSACASPWVPANRGMAGLDEWTAFRLHALAGVPSPKTHYLHFRVIDDVVEAPEGDQYGGDLWGLYLSQEHPDGRFLQRLGLPDGTTYKIEGGNGDRKHQGPFESNYGDFVNQARRKQTAEWWRAHMNMKAYYSFRAVNRAQGNIDIREGWNHYFYHHPNGQWFPIPWDLDMTFMPETHWSGTIDAKACLNVDELAVEYSNRCRELLDLLLSDRSAGGGQAGSMVEEAMQWVGTRKEWIEVVSLEKTGGSTATAISPGPHGYATGDRVTIVGTQTNGYDGDHEITVTAENSFTFRVSIFASGNIEGSEVRAGRAIGTGSAWSEIDMAMWNHHPRTAEGHKGNFYVNPTNQDFRGGTLKRTLSSADLGGFAEYLKDYVTDTDPDEFKVGDGDQRGYGYNHVELEADDGNAPDQPSISYHGGEGYPVDELTFATSQFSGGHLLRRQHFTAMEWRLGEIYNPSTPNYEANTPWRYEIDATWESGVLEEFAQEITVPRNAARPGATYRARVRHRNQLGGWSRWSEPIEFVAGLPDLSVYDDLVISELMYHPGAPSEEELDAGYRREDFEFIEVYNRGRASLDLEPLRFTKGVDFDFDGGEVRLLEPGKTVLVVAHVEAFTMRYGDRLAVAGSYSGNLSNGGERLKLSFGAGTPVIDFTYDDGGDWPSESDGDGRSLVRRSHAAEADLSAAASWAAGKPGGTPGAVSQAAPVVPGKRLSILSIERRQEGLNLTWTSVAGKTYGVEFAQQLGAGDWEVVAEVRAEGPTTAREDFEKSRTGSSEGYYRIRELP